MYSGDTTRDRDAKTITLEEDGRLTGVDVTIPASKLHSVSGAVLDARTGQPLNAGQVSLAYSDDGSTAASTNIDAATSAFLFNFVADGQYKLKTRDAREVRYDPVSLDLYGMPEDRKSTTLRSYGAGEMPLVILGDINGVNLPVSAVAPRP